MKIILFRHGQKQSVKSTDYAVKTSVLLTPNGIDQVNKLAKALASDYSDFLQDVKFFSSPFVRTVQSAEIVREELDIPEFFVEQSLAEFYAYNDYSQNKDARKAKQKRALTDFNWVSDETGLSTNQRIDSLKRFFLKEYQLGTQNLLCASHGGAIRSFVYSVMPDLKPDDSKIIDAKIHEGGFTVIDFDGKNFELVKFDVHDHLDSGEIGEE